jgi:hypothetical protein
MKRLVIVLASIIVVIGVVALGYFLRFGSTGTTGGTQGTGSLPEAQTGTIPSPGSSATGGSAATSSNPATQSVSAPALLANNVLAYIPTSNGAVVLHANGQVERVGGGTNTLLSSTTLDTIQWSAFSSNGLRLGVLYGNSGQLRFAILDVTTGMWTTISGVESAAWSPNGNTLAYLVSGATGSTLTTLDTSKISNKPQSITVLHEQDMQLVWASASHILLAPKSSAQTLESLWSFDIQQKSLVPLVLDQPGILTKWDTTGARGILFTSGEQRGGTLALIDGSGATIKQFSFLTIPSKCAFSLPAQSTTSTASSTTTGASKKAPSTTLPKQLICAVPHSSDQFANNQLPDTYDKHALYTVDDIYSIDLESGDALFVLSSNQGVSVDADAVTVTGATVYFINRYDQNLYSLPLPQ